MFADVLKSEQKLNDQFWGNLIESFTRFLAFMKHNVVNIIRKTCHAENEKIEANLFAMSLMKISGFEIIPSGTILETKIP